MKNALELWIEFKVVSAAAANRKTRFGFPSPNFSVNNRNTSSESLLNLSRMYWALLECNPLMNLMEPKASVGVLTATHSLVISWTLASSLA